MDRVRHTVQNDTRQPDPKIWLLARDEEVAPAAHYIAHLSIEDDIFPFLIESLYFLFHDSSVFLSQETFNQSGVLAWERTALGQSRSLCKTIFILPMAQRSVSEY
jgi:hypothetical protein